MTKKPCDECDKEEYKCGLMTICCKRCHWESENNRHDIERYCTECPDIMEAYYEALEEE